jgi:hypothetical protein
MRHARPETLARYSEGDLSDRKAARIRAHLASCARCARLRDDLAAVPALLADAMVPPLPEHLAARIQTALMTESARRAGPAGAAGAAGTAGSAEPARPAGAARPARATRPSRSSRPRRAAPGGRLAWRSPRAATVAAGAAIIVVVGGGSSAIVQGLSGGGGTSGSSSAASAAGSRSDAGGRVAAPAIRAAGPAVSYLHGGKPASFTPIATTTDFVPGRLAAQVRAALASGVASSSSTPRIASPLVTPGRVTSQGASGSPGGIGGFPVTGLAACVSRISAGRLVLLVDVATYQSSPAAVIVAAASPQQPRQVWVVGTGCSASASDVLKHLTLAAGR